MLAAYYAADPDSYAGNFGPLTVLHATLDGRRTACGKRIHPYTRRTGGDPHWTVGRHDWVEARAEHYRPCKNCERRVG